VVVAVGGADREDLAVTLDTIALTAGHLPASRLADLARPPVAETGRAGAGRTVRSGYSEDLGPRQAEAFAPA
jgi:hypothetical protein